MLIRFSCSASFPLLNNENSCVSCSPPPRLCTRYLTLIQVLPVQQSISYRFLIRQKSVVAVSALDMWGRGAALPRVPQQRRTAARAAAFGLCWWLLSARAAVRPRLRCLQRRGTGTRLRERLPGCKLRLVAAR